MKEKTKITLLLVGIAIVFLVLPSLPDKTPATEALTDFSLDGAGAWWDSLSNTKQTIFYIVGGILFVTIIVNLWFGESK